MLDRVRRSSEAAKYHPKASDGMIKCCQPPCPLVGSQCSHTENTKIMTNPSQKPGMASPNRATTFPRLSHPLLTRTAETMPAGMPMKKDSKVAASANSREFGK